MKRRQRKELENEVGRRETTGKVETRRDKEREGNKY